MKSLNKKLYNLVCTAVLIAVMIVMHFTFGYITAGAVEICFMMIPVFIGAIVLGPASGALLGGIFGLSSFLCCFGIGHPSVFGETLLSINPFYDAILCFVPRILMGFLVGVIFRLISRVDKKQYVAVLVSSTCGALLNTAFFMTGLILMFGNTDYIIGLSLALGKADSILAFVVALVGINGLIEAVACLLIGSVLSRVLIKYIPRLNGGN